MSKCFCFQAISRSIQQLEGQVPAFLLTIAAKREIDIRALKAERLLVFSHTMIRRSKQAIEE